MTERTYPWTGAVLPPGNWELCVPEGLPSGVGLGPLQSAQHAETYWAVFFWDGDDARVLSVHRTIEDGWPSLAIAHIVATFVDQHLTEDDLRTLFTTVQGAHTHAETMARTATWLRERFGVSDPMSLLELAAMPTPETYH